MDMIHPSAVAVDYIWDQLAHLYLDQSPLSTEIIKSVQAINKGLKHRPLTDDPKSSTAYQKFLEQQLQIIEKLESSYSYLDFREEKRLFSKHLSIPPT